MTEPSPDYEQKIVEAISEEERNTPDLASRITLSSGVVLAYRPVPILRIQNVMRKFRHPEVPEFWDDVREKNIKNPSHPIYIEMCEQVDMDRTFAMIDTIIAYGTSAIEIPSAIEPIDSDVWAKECQELFDIDLQDASEKARYLAWVKFVAVIDIEDFQKISNAFNLAVGVSESKVASVLQDRFPDHKVRHTAK